MQNHVYQITYEKRNDKKRILALDAIRGLAVAGMFIQHFALNQINSFVSGNTMILFMFCSGISYVLMQESMERKGIAPGGIRGRILARSVFIDLAGYVLLMLNGPFGVVLPAYAMLFLIAMPFAKLDRKKLLVATAVSFPVCPVLMICGQSLFSGAALLQDIAGGPLSGVAWAPVFFAGMAVGKTDFRNRTAARKLIFDGIRILIPVKLFAVTILPFIRNFVESWMAKQGLNYAVDEYAAWPANCMPVQWHMLFVDAPQGGSAFELLIGLGAALMIFGLFCLAEDMCGKLLLPFCGAGCAALSLYVLQFLVAWGLAKFGIDVTAVPVGSMPFGDILVAAAALGIGALLSRLKKGTLEAGLRSFERIFTA